MHGRAVDGTRIKLEGEGEARAYLATLGGQPGAA